MSSSWVPININDLAFKATPYKMTGHSWYTPKRLGRQVCKRCSLIALKNPFTAWCIRMGCNYSDHTQYKLTIKRLTGRNK